MRQNDLHLFNQLEAKMKDEELKKIHTDVVIGSIDILLGVAVPPYQIYKSAKDRFHTLKEQMFNEKLTAFLNETKSGTNEADRENFLFKLEEKEDEFYFRIISAIERLENKVKAAIAGKLFKGLVKEEISNLIYMRLMSALERLNMEELNYFSSYGEDKVLSEVFPKVLENDDSDESLLCKSISNYGLYLEIQTLETQHGTSLKSNQYELTILGTTFLSYI